MAKYILSERDYKRLQELIRWFDRNKHNLIDRFRRRSVNISSVGAQINIKIFEVQSAAAGDGIYSCYEQTLDATEWPDTAGDPKFDDKNTTSIEVLNLAEFDPEAEYIAHLAAGDLIAAWQMTDDEDNSRWIGVPFRKANADRVRKAYCKNDADSGSTITCYLDVDATGTEITVNCNISGGSDLNKAIRRLKDGDILLVQKVGANWFAVEGFQTIDETKGLGITDGKLVIKVDSNELKFGGSGELATKLYECET